MLKAILTVKNLIILGSKHLFAEDYLILVYVPFVFMYFSIPTILVLVQKIEEYGWDILQ